jgi:two-component system, NtrC family, response regulator AtoC
MRILIAEDDDATRRGIATYLRTSGHEVTAVAGGLEALARLRQESHDLVLSDVRMPGMDGLTLLSELRTARVQAPVIVMTAFATVEEAVRALKAGADDYVTKPLNLDELSVRIERVAQRLALVQENRRLKDRLERMESPQMVGGGRAMVTLRKAVDRLSNDPDVPVMIYGESGTGKELVARTIHCQSLRAGERFVDLSCAALPDDLLESELFGYRKGAFTGASRDKDGILREADRGTLFLDEVAEMSPRMQSRLLRFLQEHTIMPVGATTSEAVNARVIGASNQDLMSLVRAGRFREDLYYRMNVVELHLPPLRERVEDIPFLVHHFMDKHAGARRPLRRLSRDFLACLERYHWPGNIRELENLVRILLVECEREEAVVEDLPTRFRQPEGRSAGCCDGEGNQTRYRDALLGAVARFESEFLRRHLERNQGNISRTAASIGLSRVALHRKIKQHRLEP